MTETANNIQEFTPTPQRTGAALVTIDQQRGGLQIANAQQALEIAQLMCRAKGLVPPILMDNPGACLGVIFQATNWGLDPYACARGAYMVNNQLAYMSQIIQAAIIRNAPIKGRIRFTYDGEGEARTCTAIATPRDGTPDLTYTSPTIRSIPIKNSPLWKSDPDQQLSYYAGRALCRRYFPDILAGAYDPDELEGTPTQERSADRPRIGGVLNPLDDDVTDAHYSEAAPFPEGWQWDGGNRVLIVPDAESMEAHVRPQWGLLTHALLIKTKAGKVLKDARLPEWVEQKPAEPVGAAGTGRPASEAATSAGQGEGSDHGGEPSPAQSPETGLAGSQAAESGPEAPTPTEIENARQAGREARARGRSRKLPPSKYSPALREAWLAGHDEAQ